MIRLILVGLTAVSLTGCHEHLPDPPPQIFPVSGKVLRAGKPMDGAYVKLLSVAPAPGQERWVPSATTDAEGNFVLSTYNSGDGAPPGDYVATVLWPEIFKDKFGDPMEGKDRLGGRYATPQRSPLKVTVEEGDNQLPPLKLK